MPAALSKLDRPGRQATGAPWRERPHVAALPGYKGTAMIFEAAAARLMRSCRSDTPTTSTTSLLGVLTCILADRTPSIAETASTTSEFFPDLLFLARSNM